MVDIQYFVLLVSEELRSKERELLRIVWESAGSQRDLRFGNVRDDNMKNDARPPDIDLRPAY